MGRPKKDAAVKAEGATAPSSDVADEGKKAAVGRGKRPAKAPADSELPKRTLRSNSSATTLVEPQAATVEAVKKQTGKGKKAAAAVEPEPKANGEANGTPENGEAAGEGESKKTSSDKGAKGKKKNAKADNDVKEVQKKNGYALSNGKSDNDAMEEDQKVPDSSANGTGAAEKDKSKPVKSGKKKADSKEKVEQPGSGGAQSEVQENGKDKEKTASGRGKKKTETVKEEEAVAPKKAKKDVKSSKSAEDVVGEVKNDGEETSKPAPADTKKGKGKGAGAKVKAVNVEHCKS